MDREITVWRQGSLVKSNELCLLGITVTLDSIAVVISHDCDIPHKAEKVIELIELIPVIKIDPQLCNARNVRKLQLGFVKDGSEEIFELNFQNRIIVDKDHFREVCSEPDDRFSISDKNKQILKQWLAVRYGRPAYPNSFENRIKNVKVGRVPLERKLAKLIEPFSRDLIGIWIDLDTDKNLELPPQDFYYVKMFLVYRTDLELDTSRKSIEKLAVDIQELFDEAFDQDLDKVVLDTCEAVADNRFSLTDIMKFDQWRIEYISISANDDSYYSTGR